MECWTVGGTLLPPSLHMVTPIHALRPKLFSLLHAPCPALPTFYYAFFSNYITITNLQLTAGSHYLTDDSLARNPIFVL